MHRSINKTKFSQFYRTYCGSCNSIESRPIERYLIFFGYIGTKFRGAEKELARYENYEEDTCIEGVVKKALNKIDPHLNKENLCLSSYTDAGVHALQSAAHCDLWIPYYKTYKGSRADYVTFALNKTFVEEKKEIRVFKSVLVPKTFHAHFSAIGQTCLYRFGVLDVNKDFSQVCDLNYDALIPLAELNRTHFIKAPFDINASNEACQLLQGEKNLGAFTSLRKNDSKSSIRNLNRIEITPTEPLMNPCYDLSYADIKFYNLICAANSFCYRQVLRMAAVILAIGKGDISIDYLKMLLDNPQSSNLNHRLKSVSEGGLYLVNVDYPPEAFVFEEESLIQNSESAAKVQKGFRKWMEKISLTNELVEKTQDT